MHRAWNFTLAFALFGTLAATMSPRAAHAEADKKTIRTWKAKCASCHGEDGKGATEQGKKMGVRDMTSADFAKETDARVKRALIEARFGPLVEVPAKASSTARRFRFADGFGEIGFVNPVSEPFCSSCDRIRLTADGQLRTCLFSRREWDLKAPLRDGSSDERIAELIRFAVHHKELKHRVNEPGFVRASRSMSQIGG